MSNKDTKGRTPEVELCEIARGLRQAATLGCLTTIAWKAIARIEAVAENLKQSEDSPVAPDPAMERAVASASAKAIIESDTVQAQGDVLSIAPHSGADSTLERGSNDNTAESFEGYLKRRLGDHYTAIVIAALDAIEDGTAR